MGSRLQRGQQLQVQQQRQRLQCRLVQSRRRHYDHVIHRRKLAVGRMAGVKASAVIEAAEEQGCS